MQKEMADFTAIIDVLANADIAPPNIYKSKNLRGNFLKNRKQLLCQLIGQKKC